MKTTKVSLVMSALVGVVLLAACGVVSPDEAVEQGDLKSTMHGRGMTPMMEGKALIQNASSPAGAHLTYFGGKQNVQPRVIPVLYGTGSYLAQVSGGGTPSLNSFYNQFLQKTTLTTGLLQQYNAGGQTYVNTGTSVAPVTITPAAARNGATITDAQIQAELDAQIAAGTLPAPTTDASGKPVTYYAVFFPPGKTINQGGSNSCVAGGFCAYHGTVALTAAHGEYYYGVHPDMQPGSGCATGCGSSTTFGNYTSVASHELVEMMNDAEVGLATVVGPPLAWYDSTNGEIGDICNGQQGTFAGCDGQTYTYQLEFSNAAPSGNACVGVTPACGTTTNDFSISASPATVSVTAGASGTTTISTAITSGVGQSVSLSASGVPAGASATFSPASITSGGASTLTLNSGTAAAGTYSITVTGTGASATHTTAVTFVIGGSGTCTSSSQLLLNPGFESGSANWVASAGVIDGSTSGSAPRTGTFKAWLNGYGTTHTDTLYQQVAVPASACTATFSFWLKITTAETTTTTAFDKLTVTVRNSAGTVLSTLATYSNLNKGTTYVQKSFDLSAFKGQTIRVFFNGAEDSSLQTSFFVDDTALTVTQ